MTFRSRILLAGCGVAGVSVLAAAAVALAAPASPATGADNTQMCFRVQDVDGISVSSPVGPKKLDGVYMKMNNKDVYQLTLSTLCPELKESTRLGVESITGSGTVCMATDAHIIASSKLTGQRRECWGNELRKLTPAEVAAIPSKERP